MPPLQVARCGADGPVHAVRGGRPPRAVNLEGHRKPPRGPPHPHPTPSLEQWREHRGRGWEFRVLWAQQVYKADSFSPGVLSGFFGDPCPTQSLRSPCRPPDDLSLVGRPALCSALRVRLSPASLRARHPPGRVSPGIWSTRGKGNTPLPADLGAPWEAVRAAGEHVTFSLDHSSMNQTVLHVSQGHGATGNSRSLLKAPRSWLDLSTPLTLLSDSRAVPKPQPWGWAG